LAHKAHLKQEGESPVVTVCPYSTSQIDKKRSRIMFKFHNGLAGVLLITGSAGAWAAPDAARGKVLYESRCIACHSVDQNRVGPAHEGVFGRRAGVVAGYDYSPALKKSKVVWSAKTLDQWLTNPERLIAGQKMGYSVTGELDRADLIAYLKTLGKP
jgi:cytochrome c